MRAALTKSKQPKPRRFYLGADIPVRLVRRFARQVVEQFHPNKIILFGSYAYGTPNADSDVDILVIMPTKNKLDQAVKISCQIDPPFSLDIIVRTPHEMKWRLAEGESFLTEIVTKGKVLYELSDSRMGAKGRGGLRRGKRPRSEKPAGP
ncbi:MAG: nucleotidyltransferase domain-containing protein [Planctomycetes bacterium]|nr:nucleotidyltransferase domain-containing protein [Planctomycetota bacterium]